MAGGVMEEKISEYEFVVRAIKRLKSHRTKVSTPFTAVLIKHSGNTSTRIRWKLLPNLLKKGRS